MINYALKCSKGHRFDSWFKSASAFDALKAQEHLACTTCGTAEIEKDIMAPRVTSGKGEAPVPNLPDTQKESEAPLAALRKHVEENADYVGGSFAQEARSMFLGTSPERAIYGEASGAEAKALIEDGVPVAPLPFVPNRKAN